MRTNSQQYTETVTKTDFYHSFSQRLANPKSGDKGGISQIEPGRTKAQIIDLTSDKPELKTKLQKGYDYKRAL